MGKLLYMRGSAMGRGGESGADAETLARHITAILNHPATPDGIYNALYESLLELADDHQLHIQHPRILPVALKVLLGQGGES